MTSPLSNDIRTRLISAVEGGPWWWQKPFALLVFGGLPDCPTMWDRLKLTHNGRARNREDGS